MTPWDELMACRAREHELLQMACAVCTHRLGVHWNGPCRGQSYNSDCEFGCPGFVPENEQTELFDQTTASDAPPEAGGLTSSRRTP